MNLPAHILSKLERRWASRLARDAAAWRHEKPPHADHKEIVDRTGRHVSVSIRRSRPTGQWKRRLSASPEANCYTTNVGFGGWAVRG